MKLVRISTENNFNCTDTEYNQIKSFETKYPTKTFFVNSNINTPKLDNIKNHKHKAVITINPDLVVDLNKLKRLEAIKHKVSFVRVKWLPYNQSIKDLIIQLSKRFKVVITVQRFRNYETMIKFTSRNYYEWKHNYFRLNENCFQQLVDFKNGLSNVYICDENHKGCIGCGYCSRFNGGESNDIQELNLSSSGVCRFNCPSCFAKCIQKYTGRIAFDVIKQNDKQKGKLNYT